VVAESIIAKIAGEGVGSLFTGIGSLIKDIRSAWTGEPTPEKQAEIEQRLMELEFVANKTQNEINLQEAKHPNIFVSGWRPFIGWTCGAGILYNFVLNPIGIWILKLYGVEIIPPPLDIGSLMTLVLSLLGLGGMRTYEKYKNVNSKH
jgi:hypothetical protein